MPYPMAATIRSGKPVIAVAAGGTNWWEVSGKTCVAAYQPKGAASLAASYTNLANPGTYDAAPGTAPSFDTATGWTFDGSTQYLTTGVVPTATYTIIARFSNTTQNNEAVMGANNNSGARMTMFPRRGSTDDWVFLYGNGQLADGARLTSGIMALAAANAYVDGSSVGTVSGTFSGTAPDLYIGGQNYPTGGGFFSAFQGDIQAVAIYSDTLTSTQVGTLTTAMNAL